jgi:hypothetical protein
MAAYAASAAYKAIVKTAGKQDKCFFSLYTIPLCFLLTTKALFFQTQPSIAINLNLKCRSGH